MNQTTSIKEKDIIRHWYLIDCKDKTLGRISTKITSLLIGKKKTNFAFNLDCGDYVVLINAKKIVLTKNKLKTKMYYDHSGYIGGLRKRTAEDILKNNPCELIKRSINGMLPKNKLRKQRIKRLYIYSDENHQQQAQKLISLK